MTPGSRPPGALPRPGLVVVVPCSRRKRTGGCVRARDLYIGSYHLACRRYAERMGADVVLVLSARHGLVGLDEVIEPYDLRMGEPGAVGVEQLRRQAAAMGLLGHPDVVVLGGRRYVAAGRQVWPDARAPLEGSRGIGEQLARLARGP